MLQDLCSSSVCLLHEELYNDVNLTSLGFPPVSLTTSFSVLWEKKDRYLLWHPVVVEGDVIAHSATAISSLTVRGLVAYLFLQNFLHLKRWSIGRELETEICEESIPGNRRWLWCWRILSGIQTGIQNVHSSFDLPTQMLTDPRVDKCTEVEYHVQDISLTNWSETTEVQETPSITLEGLTHQGKSCSSCVKQGEDWHKIKYSFEPGN